MMGLAPVRETDVALLVQEARKGCSNSFADLTQRYSSRLFHFVLSMGLPRPDAEDIVQDTLLKAYENLEQYDPQYSFSTWLFTIGRRLAINHLRDRRKTMPLTAFAIAGAAAKPDYERDEIDGIWRSAAQWLDDREYTVLWLRYGEELPIRGIAEQMGLSEQNTRVILHRARACLAEKLKETND